MRLEVRTSWGKFVLPATSVIPLLSRHPILRGSLVQRVVLGPPAHPRGPYPAVASSPPHPPHHKTKPFSPSLQIPAGGFFSAVSELIYGKEALLGVSRAGRPFEGQWELGAPLPFAPKPQACTYGAGLAQMLSVQVCTRSG